MINMSSKTLNKRGRRKIMRTLISSSTHSLSSFWLSSFMMMLLLLVFTNNINNNKGGGVLFATAKEYDYIVIGAGSAGCIVAAELVEKGAQVLLVEAGSDNNDPAISSLYSYFSVAFNTYNFGWLHWGYETTEQTLAGAQNSNDKVEPRSIYLPQGRSLGGTFNINAAAYVQGHSSDFDTIAKLLSDDDWAWANTKKFRTKLERMIDVTELGDEQVGASEFIQAAKDILGFPYNEKPLDGDHYGIAPSFWAGRESNHGGIRTTSYDAFLRPLLDQNNLDIVTHHEVLQILFDDDDDDDASNNKKAIGVVAYNERTFSNVEFYASQGVIISAGTYNTPKLLLRSGIGPQAHLSQVGIDVKVDLPGVGSNLRDHYGVATFWNLVDLPMDAPFLFQSPGLNMFGPESSGPTSYQFELSGNFGSVIPLRQTSVGTVRLDSNKDIVIDPNVLSTSEDIDALVVGLHDYLLPYFRELMRLNLVSPGSINPDATKEELRSFVLANIGTNHHPAGTAKVGADNDDMAVLDSNFNVRGTSNLCVVDASIFPTVPSGNTNAATMTVALLAAEKILLNQNQQNEDRARSLLTKQDKKGDKKLRRAA